MNYYKIELLSNSVSYALREYFPYTDKPFFKSIDDIASNNELGENLALIIAQLYKDELVFLYPNIENHSFIVPIIHKSSKFSKVNRIICESIAKALNIHVVDDYFDEIDIPYVDIRDEYTKDGNSISLKINEKYKDTPVIVFDYCCSTGIILNSISSIQGISEFNLYLSYGIRFFNKGLTKDFKNSFIKEYKEYSFECESSECEPGYTVIIRGLFGYKDVEVDLRDTFSIDIGENGFGKSTATKLAVLAIKYIREPRTNELIEQLSKYYFDKIEVYYHYYFYNFVNDIKTPSSSCEDLELDEQNNIKESLNNSENNDIIVNDYAVGDVVFNKYFGRGIVQSILNDSCEVLFDDCPEGTKRILCNRLSREEIVDSPNSNVNLLNSACSNELFFFPDEIVISFVDSNDFCFHQQKLKRGETIRKDELIIFGLENHPTTEYMGYGRFYKDEIIKYSSFKITYDFLKEHGEYVNTQIDSFSYDDCIMKKVQLRELKNNNVDSVLNAITDDEYRSLIRKIILNDRSIEILYNDFLYKYKISDDEIRGFDNAIRSIVSNGSKTNNNFIFCADENLLYFNCTASRRIVSKPPRDRFVTGHYDDYSYSYGELECSYDGDDNYMEYDEPDYEPDYESEENRVNEDRMSDPSAWNYDDPEDYNPYEDEYDFEGDDYANAEWDSLVDAERDAEDEEEDFEEFDEKDIDVINDISDLYYYCSCVFVNQTEEISKDDTDVTYNHPFDSEEIYLHKVIHNLSASNNISTPFFSILNKVIYYDDLQVDDDQINISLFKNNKYTFSKREFLEKNKNRIDSLCNKVINSYLPIFSFGIYDLIDEEEYDRLYKIIRRLISNGLQSINDYLIIVGLDLLIESYKNDFITDKHILLEKIINKYLINKSAHIYHSNIVIVDNNNNYVPIDRLSTGEKNLIIIFSLCISNDGLTIILDEPDLSMSVDWQSKVLVDLLRFTANNYMVISQSPLLIQKNTLSIFVKRMDVIDEDKYSNSINSPSCLETITEICNKQIICKAFKRSGIEYEEELKTNNSKLIRINYDVFE